MGRGSRQLPRAPDPRATVRTPQSARAGQRQAASTEAGGHVVFEFDHNVFEEMSDL